MAFVLVDPNQLRKDGTNKITRLTASSKIFAGRKYWRYKLFYSLSIKFLKCPVFHLSNCVHLLFPWCRLNFKALT